MARVEIEYPAQTHFSLTLPVRIVDVNYQRHLGHDHLISMLHEVRSQFFESMQLPELGDQSMGTLVADLSIQFINEAFYGDSLCFELSVQALSKRSCEIYYRVSKAGGEQSSEDLSPGLSDGVSGHLTEGLVEAGSRNSTANIVARAKTGIVFFDYELKKAAEVPVHFKSRFHDGNVA